MGNGSVYRRNGAWCVNFKTAEGKRVRETIGPSKKIAERVLSLRMTQVLENRYFPPSRVLGRMPFNEFAQMYLERVVPLMKSARTERNRVKSWIKILGTRPLGLLTRMDIEAWRREKMVTCKTSTINRSLSRIRRMLHIAVEWDLLDESPMTGMKFQRENNARTRYLSIEECQRLINSCIAPHIRAIVSVAAHAGLRLSEILNLCWRDIDFHSGFILVRDSKNGEARHVPMDETLLALFSTYPHRPDIDLIFVSPSGGRYTNIRGAFKNACKRAGITDLHFHDLRHSYASNFVMGGGDIFALQILLGHKAITMTQRYAHLSPAYKIKAIDRMNTLWQSALPVANRQTAVSESAVVTPASQASSQDSLAPA
jgi:integrase